MKVLYYTHEKKQIWDDFVNHSKMPMFMFNRDFMEYHQDRFQDASIMFYNDSDDLMAVMPASRHGTEIRSHGGLTYGGIICAEKMKQHIMLDCFQAMKDFFISVGCQKVIYKSIPYIYHNYSAQEDLYALFIHNANVQKIEPACVIELAHPYKMPKGRKAQISRARREGIYVRETEDFETFIEIENQVLKKYHNAVAVHTGQELSYLHNKFPSNIRCFGAYDAFGTMVGGGVVFVYEHTVHAQYLAANEYARENGGLDLVISELIELFKGKKYFDFGISTENMGRFFNQGLIAQKEGFGGRTVAYQTWEIEL